MQDYRANIVTCARSLAPGFSTEMTSTTGGNLSCCRVTSPDAYKSVPSVCRSGALPAEPRWTDFAAAATLPPTLLGGSHRRSLKAESVPSSCTRSAEAPAPSECDAAGAVGWVEAEQEGLEDAASSTAAGVPAQLSVCTLIVGSHATSPPPTAPALEQLRPELEARRRQAEAKARLLQHARHNHLERDYLELLDTEPRNDGAAWHKDLLTPVVRAVFEHLLDGRAAVVGVGLMQQHDRVAVGERGSDLFLTIGGKEVAFGKEDENGLRLLHVCQSARPTCD
eukprot:scaffold76565_cov61-Phaeocystis_antarctica.AAC.5